MLVKASDNLWKRSVSSCTENKGKEIEAKSVEKAFYSMIYAFIHHIRFSRKLKMLIKHLEFNIHLRSNMHSLNGAQKKPFFRD